MRLPTFLKRQPQQQPAPPLQTLPPYQSAKREESPQELYKNLKMKPADPNKAKLYAWALCCAAGFIALLTFRSNLDYFMQYYLGWSLQIRVAVFLGVEGYLILAPLTKGYGNRRQIRWAFAFEFVMIPLLFLHTYLVGASLETRKETEATKITAQADLNRERLAAREVAESNQRAQDSFNQAQKNYNAAMARYERLMKRAQRDGTAMPRPPVPPPEPKFIPVPTINEGLVINSTLAVSDVVQGKVDHNTLRALQFIILLCAIAGTTCIVLCADAMRIRAWFMKHRDYDLEKTMRSQAPYQMIDQPAQLVVAVSKTQAGLVLSQRQPPGFTIPIAPAAQVPEKTQTVNPAQIRAGCALGNS